MGLVLARRVSQRDFVIAEEFCMKRVREHWMRIAPASRVFVRVGLGAPAHAAKAVAYANLGQDEQAREEAGRIRRIFVRRHAGCAGRGLPRRHRPNAPSWRVSIPIHTRRDRHCCGVAFRREQR